MTGAFATGRVALILPAAFCGLAYACEEVPTLTFAQDAAAQDAAEGGTPPSMAADVEGGCPGADPPSAPFVCCGSIACEGQCTGQCDACLTKCTTPGVLCCAKTNNVVCLSAGSICH